jgi:glutathionylspermidine synthase
MTQCISRRPATVFLKKLSDNSNHNQMCALHKKENNLACNHNKLHLMCMSFYQHESGYIRDESLDTTQIREQNIKSRLCF